MGWHLDGKCGEVVHAITVESVTGQRCNLAINVATRLVRLYTQKNEKAKSSLVEPLTATGDASWFTTCAGVPLQLCASEQSKATSTATPMAGYGWTPFRHAACLITLSEILDMVSAHEALCIANTRHSWWPVER